MSKTAGYTSINSAALNKLAMAITADTFAVQPDQVSVRLQDSQGKLGMYITTALPQSIVSELVTAKDRTLFTLSEELTNLIVQKMTEVSGHAIGEVRISFNHIVEDKPARRVK